MVNKLDTDEFIARLKKITKRLGEHKIRVDIEICPSGYYHPDKEPCLVFRETAWESCLLFEAVITIARFIDMDDEKFDRIFEIEFGKEIKEYKPWDGI